MNRKGITAVVAIVLLLMMTVGAAGLAYVWVTNLQGNIQKTAEGGVSDISDQQDARITIESVYNTSSGNIIFILRNVGRYTFLDEGNFKVYVNGTNASVTSGFTAGSSNAPKSVRTVSIAAAFPSYGRTVDLKVTSEVSSATATYSCTPDRPGASSC